MANRVGAKGQVVISKKTRDQLGIEPGWEALESVVGDRVVLSFVPPQHLRSISGRLRRYARGKASARAAEGEVGWESAARQKEEPWRR